MSTGTIQELSIDLTELRAQLSTTAQATDREMLFPSVNVKLLREKKLLGLLIPKEYGGLEGDAELFVRVIQTVGSACASTGMVFVMHCTAVETIAKHQPANRALLEAAAAGHHLSTLACSERGTGANFYASFSTSTRSQDGYVLNGDKCFVTSGGYADSYVVSTRAVGSGDSINTSIYVAAKDAPGLSFHGQWQGLGLRGNSSIALKLDNCYVPAQNLVGEMGAGLQIEMTTILPRFLLGSAAVYNGVSQAAFDSAVSHIGTRVHVHTGDSLSMLPVVRHKVAQMKVALDSSVALTEKAARLFQSQSPEALVWLLEAKQLACRTAVNVANTAMETCGGIAYSDALTIERHLRDAQAGGVMAPTIDISLDLVGRAALGLPLM
jgi:alkylation response protein AidB-like acyl-CoA dehydrogenase